MEIKNLKVPEKLIDLIKNEFFTQNLNNRINDIFPFLDAPMVFLKTIGEISSLSTNQDIIIEDVFKIGSSKKTRRQIPLPSLDYDNSLFIAINKEIGDDLAIALDYRIDSDNPRVVASDFSNKLPYCEWKVIANTFNEFCEKIDLTNYNNSPLISSIKWGEIIIDNKTFKDVKCYPGGKREWDWNENGTKHIPGILVKDLNELIDKGAEVIILSKGYHEKLQTHPDSIDFLKSKNIPYFILQTEEAVKKYNELCTIKKVGGLFHSTC